MSIVKMWEIKKIKLTVVVLLFSAISCVQSSYYGYRKYDHFDYREYDCSTPLLEHAELSATSALEERGANNARLNEGTSWSAKNSDFQQQLIVDLGSVKNVTVIATQGRPHRTEYVTEYTISYGYNGLDYTDFKEAGGNTKIFKGNVDSDSIRYNFFDVPIIAQWVRINPIRWNDRISLRIELYGCDYEAETVYFNGTSLLRYDLLRDPLAATRESIRFRFKTTSANGVLMYSRGTQGDYIALQLKENRMILNIDLGSRIMTSLSVGSLLDDNIWHDVVLTRNRRDVIFLVDRVMVQGRIKGEFDKLDLNRAMYFGGIPYTQDGLVVSQNYTGCIENIYLNTTNFIREMKNSLTYGESYQYSKINTLYSCPEPPIIPVTFLTRGSHAKLKGYEGQKSLNCSFSFRTYEDRGMMFFHEFLSRGFVKVFLHEGKVKVELMMPDGSSMIFDNYDEQFNDGRWHSLVLTISRNSLILDIDQRPMVTNKQLAISTSHLYYIGGGRDNEGFLGCMRMIAVDGNFRLPTDWKTEEYCCKGEIIFDSCHMNDRCNPNPCFHNAACRQNSKEFFCDCTNTGYAGAVCHTSLNPLSCQAYKNVQSVQQRAHINVDVDGSGPLEPFPVTCEFYSDGRVVTVVGHSQEHSTAVDGFQEPGSFEQNIIYEANMRQIEALLNRSHSCWQRLSYSCQASRLFNSPSEEQTFRPFSWWVSRQNQPMNYWAGALPGSRKCECGILGNCYDPTKWCNCDSNYLGWLEDSGDIREKEYLPVRAVRFGDTGTALDEKQGRYTLGSLMCEGDDLFNNMITFRISDANIELPPFDMGHSGDIYLEFKTTIENAVLFHAKGPTDYIKLSINGGSKLQFEYQAGSGPLGVTVETSYHLNDNRWHSVSVERNRKEARLVVDGALKAEVREPPGPVRALYLNSVLSLGSTLDYRDGYVGCIRALLLNGVMVDLNYYGNRNLYGIAPGCIGRCESNPCLNNGTCFERYDGYSCDCRWSAFKGPICADEIGVNLRSSSIIKYDFLGSWRSTIQENIRVGFTTTNPRGFLLGFASNISGEYLTIQVSNSGHLRVVFDFGFERQELIYPEKQFHLGQYHNFRFQRRNSGKTVVLTVDNYEAIEYHFDIKESADAQFNNIQYLYVGKNESMKDGFVGCVSRVEFDDIYPLKLMFQENPPPNVKSLGTPLTEDFCGVEPVTHPPTEIETRPPPIVDEDKLRRAYNQVDSAILGSVLAVIFLLLVIMAILIGRYLSRHKGEYLTQEDKGADALDPDEAMVHSTTGHQIFKGNVDSDSIRYNFFDVPIIAQWVRINPIRWNDRISLRIELYGCDYEAETVYFNGTSLLRYDLLRDPLAATRESIRFRFKTTSANGVLMYSRGTQGDYIALQLKENRMILNIDLGSRIMTSLSVGSLLDDNIWHDVVLTRNRRDVIFLVDRVMVQGRIKGEFDKLDLNRAMYFGGIPYTQDGLVVSQNYTGCIENIYLNTTNFIREMKNSLTYGESYQYSKINTLYSCPEPPIIPVTFLTRGSHAKLKGYEGQKSLNCSFSFRTYEDRGMMFFHEFLSRGFVKVFLHEGKVKVELMMPDGSSMIFDNYDEQFNDGRWHSLVLTISRNSLILDIDQRPMVTNKQLAISTSHLYYIGGGRDNEGFLGCMRMIAVDGNFRLPTDWKTEEYCCKGEIIFDSCHMNDRCNPNPCFHNAACRQNSKEFFCDCTNTGYAGAVCHTSLNPLSCQAYKNVQSVQQRAHINVDVDGSGPLEPFPVTCEFYSDGRVVTVVGHSQEHSTAVDGFQEPGSFEQNIIYEANMRQIEALLNRSHSCWQRLSYSCQASRLFNSPSEEQTFRPFSWWVSRQNQPMNYWAGALPGSRKCECGILGNCYDPTKWCNCDSNYLGWLEDSGDIREKEYLPVRAVRFGDTGTALDEKQGRYTLGSLMCEGDDLFNNMITFRISDANIELPPFDMGHSGDIYLEFKTTIENAVLFHAKGPTDYIKLSINGGSKLQFEYQAGSGPLGVTVETSYHLNDNRWHSVSVERNRKEARLVVDGALKAEVREPPGPVRALYLNSVLSLGSTLDYRDGYVGCIRALLLNGVMVDLNYYGNRNLYGIAPGCIGRCESNPCLNNGTCFERYDGYSCDCRWSAFKGPICADEIGVNLRSSSIIKYDFLGSWRSTIQENIRVGFTTTNPRGFLLGFASNISGEYLTIQVSNSGHLRVVFDFGFERQELIYPEKQFHLGQYHNFRFQRRNSGKTVVLTVDNYEAIEYHFDIKESADAQFNNIQYLYVGKNESMKDGFVGCVSRVEFDDIYPLKLMFQENPPPNVKSLGTPLTEDFCGVEPVTHPPTEIETRPPPIVDEDKLRRAYNQVDSAILGSVLAVIFLLLVIMAILIGRYLSRHKGEYLTQEDKGADALDPDEAMVHSTTGHQIFKGNVDSDSIRYNFFDVPIIAQWVRINPIRWNDRISLRIELYGCDYEAETVYFNGTSLLRYDLLRDPLAATRESIRFRFKTTSANGVLMYSRGTQGDYIALQLKENRMILNIDLGSRIMTSLSVGSLLDDNIWHDVVLTRNRRDVIFLVDRVMVQGRIKGEFDKLDLNRAMYFGGIPYTQDGLVVSQNYTGCIENIYLNTTNFIREMKNSLTYGESYQYSKINTLYSCPEPPIIPVTFLTRGSHAKLKGYEGQKSLNCSFSFRTYEDRGMMFFHEFLSRGFVKVFLHEGKVKVELMMPDGSSMIFDNYDEQFNDGRWHSLVLTISRNSLILDIDQRPMVTNKQLAISTSHLYYIGGGRDNEGFLGCMRMIAVDGNFRLPTDWKTEEYCCKGEIIFDSCHMNDRCNPNPCFHNAACRQNSKEFFCDCTNTGYAGAVCHTSLNPLSCQAYKNVQSVQQRAHINVDVDGSGPLEPFPVTCEFYSDGRVVTVVGHSQEHSTAVDGFQEPGSFEQNIIYEANMRQIEALLNRSHSCWQRLSYSCQASRLFNSPSEEQTFRPFSWWVSRQNQPMNYWAGALPGSRKCECGILGNCYDPTKWCNCDSNYLGWLEDSGDIREKEYLPVRAVRFGDTGTALDEKQGRYTLGSLMCEGDDLFNNMITFRISDANIELPPFDMGHSGDIYLEFKTTIENAVLFHAKGPTDYIKLSINGGSKLQFEYQAGSGPLGVTVETSYHLNDNRWHSVSVERNRKEARLVVDGALKAEVREPPGPVRALYLNSVLSLGSTLDYRDGYVGCIRALLLNGVMVDLNYYGNRNLYGIAPGCIGRCESNPCLNNGTCFERYDGYSCDCRWSAFKGPICADEIGVNLRSSSIIKYDFLGSWRSTIQENIRVGFTTTNPRGFLLGFASNISGEYLTIQVSNSGHLRVVFDFGFERQELIYPEKQFHLGQYHNFRFQRRNSGKTVVLTVDNYEAIEYHFDIKESADAQFNNIQYLYVGKNESMKDGFVGCVSRVEFDDIYPLKLMFQENPPPNVKSLGTPLTEDFCGVEPVTHPPTEIETRPPPIVDEDKLRRAYNQVDSAILGSVLAVIFLLLVIMAILIGRYLSRHKGEYLTQEDKGADALDPDEAMVHSTTGHQVTKRKEWFI